MLYFEINPERKSAYHPALNNVCGKRSAEQMVLTKTDFKKNVFTLTSPRKSDCYLKFLLQENPSKDWQQLEEFILFQLEGFYALQTNCKINTPIPD